MYDSSCVVLCCRLEGEKRKRWGEKETRDSQGPQGRRCQRSSS